jgi:hypothetical protein
LRKNAPLAQVEVGFDPLSLVSKHAHILEIECQPEVFHNGGGAKPGTHDPILNTKAADAWTLAETGSPADPAAELFRKDLLEVGDYPNDRPLLQTYPTHQQETYRW